MRAIIHIIKIITIITIISLLTSDIFAKPTKIFILQSYNKTNVCSFPQEKGLRKSLKNLDCIIEVFYMETKSKYNTKEKIKHQANLAVQKINKFNPDILCTIDDNAFKYVGQLYYNQPGINVVFSGMNNSPLNYSCIQSWDSPSNNITGVYENLHIIKTFNYMTKILNLDRIYVVLDYTETTSMFVLEQILKEFNDDYKPISWFVTRVKYYEEYQKLFKQFNNDNNQIAVYPVAFSLTDKDNNIISTNEVVNWTAKNSNIPTISVNYMFTKLGFTGGICINFEEMGYQMGEIVKRINNGESTIDIPIQKAQIYTTVFNKSNLLRNKDHFVIPDKILLSADEIIEYDVNY